jgi:hypothetical protein
MLLRLLAIGIALAALACTRPPLPEDDAGLPDAELCFDDDPLTRASWVGFCADHVDDNCSPAEDCAGQSQAACATDDEACPATQPASAAPDWRCRGPAPDNVIAYADLAEPNEQVAGLCVFVYESTAFPGEHYVAVHLDNGADPGGPDEGCSADIRWRRFLYFTDLDTPCDGIVIDFPETIEGQALSSPCRKAIRNVQNLDGVFDPDIQFFAASRDEALGKLAILDAAEIGCIGVVSSAPFRDDDDWVLQASAPLMLRGEVP